MESGKDRHNISKFSERLKARASELRIYIYNFEVVGMQIGHIKVLHKEVKTELKRHSSSCP